MKNVQRSIQWNRPLFRSVLHACFPFLFLSAFFTTHLQGQSDVANQESGVAIAHADALEAPISNPASLAPPNDANSGCQVAPLPSSSPFFPPPSCVDVAGMFPVNGSVFNCPITAVILSWPSVSDATEYDIYLGTNSTPPFFATTMNTSYLLPSNLPTGFYYWQVRPRNNSGVAAGCPILSFSLCPPPSCINASVVFPVNGSVFNCPITAVVLSWPAALGATEYDIYLGTNPTPPFFATTMNTSYLLPALPSGIYYWQLRPRNNGGVASGCSILSFSTIDNLAPVFTQCQGNITVSNTPSQCNGTASWPLPAASDNCGPTTLVQTAGPFSGATFPLGTTLVSFKASDVYGNASTCSFFVNVNDTQPPTLACPANITGNNTPGLCGMVKTYPLPLALDNCSIPAAPTLVSGLVSGSFFPVGKTINVWRVADGSNNTTTCSFTVTIFDIEPPTLTCPTNITANNDIGLCGAVKTHALPIALDNCIIPAPPILLSGLPSGSLFPVGVTANVYRVSDLGNNTASCSFTVTVFDIEKPKITCPANILKGNDIGFCSAKIPYLGSPVATDNCFVMAITNNSPGTFTVGGTFVTWIVSDNHGNTASCSQNVIIEDREFPVLLCPANIQVKTDEDDCIATVIYKAKAMDNCPGLVLEYSTQPSSTFHVGLTNVEVSATDEAGNNVKCTFQISVETRKEVCNGIDDDCDGLTDEAEDWTKLAKQYGSDALGQSEYGTSVDIDGDYAIVGSNQKNASGQSIGAAYILYRNKNDSNAWGQVAKLNAPGLLPGDDFGASVAISGGIAVVGSPLDDGLTADEGSVYVFYQNLSNPSIWNFEEQITAVNPEAGDNFGASVALDGNRLAVGASQDDESGSNSGAAYVFYRNQGGADNWGQVAKLLASTANANDRMGTSIAIDGDNIVAGATGVDGLYLDAGAAYIFGRNQFGADAWGQVAKLKPSLSGPMDNFGASVAISGPRAIIGADRNDHKGADAGAAFAFYKNQNGVNDSWGQSSILLDYNGKAGDRYGCAVALDGEYAVVGARGDDDFFGDDSGTGFVYLYQDNGWVLVGNLEDGGGENGDAFGSCAALSGRTAILGAPLDDAPEADKGSALVFGGLCDNGNRPEIRDAPSVVSEALIRCYPVPFSSVLHIDIKGMKAENTQVTVLNTLGQTVTSLYQGSIEDELAFRWQPNDVAAGVYFLRVVADGKVVVKTIVLER